MAGKRKHKKVWIVIVAVVLAAAIAAGCWFYFGKSSGESVNVYPFMYIGMTEYWGDQQESYGPVSTDHIQTVFLSTTQTVTGICVSEGDTVKKGDLLITYDTTLTDIALERERLKLEKLKLDLQDAYEYLAEIKAMKPMVIPEPKPEEPTESDLGAALSGTYQLSTQKMYDGTDAERALICWLAKDTVISQELLGSIFSAAIDYRLANAEPLPTEPTVPEETIAPTEATETTEATEATETTEATEATESAGPTVPEETTQPSESVPPQAPTVDRSTVYVVFKSTEGNMSLGQRLVWQGMVIRHDTAADTYSFQLYDASGFDDHTVPVTNEPEAEQPEIDFGSGYTAAQIAEMRAQQEKTIRDLQFQVKMAEADYKIKQTEAADGCVYAEIDGTVVSVLNQEEATMNQQPILKVSSGGGFYVEGSVSELQKDNLLPGQEVTVNDWDTGMTYTGIVESVADYPLSSDGGFYGNGNPNVSYYPFTVFIDGSADLQAGRYVSVMYSTAAAESGIYLENPFLRTENGQSYVYVQGADGLLEKRFVTTGKSLWGSYTEILAGLTENDLIAFPYGKHVKAGTVAVESDISELYGY